MAGGNTVGSRKRDGSSKYRPAAAASKTSKRTNVSNTETSTSEITRELQQKCLNIFADALKPSNDDASVLQEVKGHLYHRNFAEAFGREEYLRVYASRWSPSRSLAYVQVFNDISEDVSAFIDPHETNGNDSSFDVVCIGGGAGGELVALAALLSARSRSSTNTTQKCSITLIDIADWDRVVIALYDGIRTPPMLSAYASQAKKDSNAALLDDDRIAVSFKRMDVLDAGAGALVDIIAKADLVTFMFTLNELYTTCISKTQQLLSNTLTAMQNNSHLLVVDSPGSYSTVSINGAEKKYPMQWLLDYTLLGDPRKPRHGTSGWVKLRSEDSKWFRLPSRLEYPIDLEDMRYQLHLFKRMADNGG